MVLVLPKAFHKLFAIGIYMTLWNALWFGWDKTMVVWSYIHVCGTYSAPLDSCTRMVPRGRPMTLHFSAFARSSAHEIWHPLHLCTLQETTDDFLFDLHVAATINVRQCITQIIHENINNLTMRYISYLNERGYSSQKCGLTPPGGQIQNGRQQNENKSIV